LGNSVIPPSRPFSGRVRTNNSPPRVTTNAAPQCNSPDFFGALHGKLPDPHEDAPRSHRSKDSAQAGFFGVQIEEPTQLERGDWYQPAA